jgi:glycosyltransferase involved in cell wall biosynthesis
MKTKNHFISGTIFNYNIYTSKKILIVGPYPPPYGGVEIHIKRTKKKLEKQNNKVFVFDTALLKHNRSIVLFFLLKKLFKTKPDIVFFHEPTMSRLRLAAITFFKFFFRYKLVTIDHNCRLLYKYSDLNKKIFRFFIKRADKVVVIGNTTDKCYKDNFVKTKNYSIESPYLKPNFDEEKDILEKYPTRVLEFIKKRSPLITANAFMPVLIDNEDLYGFDMCVELIKKLKDKHKNIGLIFAVCKRGTENNKAYFETIKEEIKNYGLEKNFCFFINDKEFWPIIKQSDVFVRPTLSDSFGISVQEAIDCGVPAIASDVCVRPERTILFTKKSSVDFVNKVDTALKN